VGSLGNHFPIGLLHYNYLTCKTRAKVIEPHYIVFVNDQGRFKKYKRVWVFVSVRWRGVSRISLSVCECFGGPLAETGPLFVYSQIQIQTQMHRYRQLCAK